MRRFLKREGEEKEEKEKERMMTYRLPRHRIISTQVQGLQFAMEIDIDQLRVGAPGEIME